MTKPLLLNNKVLLVNNQVCTTESGSAKPEETFNVTPTTSIQTITPTSGSVFSSGTVQAMPTGSAAIPNTSIQQNSPTFSKNGDVVTASIAQKTQSVSPTISAGYVSSGTAGTITLTSNSATYTIPTETATLTTNGTHTPTSGKYFSSVTVNVSALDEYDGTIQ